MFIFSYIFHYILYISTYFRIFKYIFSFLYFPFTSFILHLILHFVLFIHLTYFILTCFIYFLFYVLYTLCTLYFIYLILYIIYTLYTLCFIYFIFFTLYILYPLYTLYFMLYTIILWLLVNLFPFMTPLYALCNNRTFTLHRVLPHSSRHWPSVSRNRASMTDDRDRAANELDWPRASRADPVTRQFFYPWRLLIGWARRPSGLDRSAGARWPVRRAVAAAMRDAAMVCRLAEKPANH